MSTLNNQLADLDAALSAGQLALALEQGSRLVAEYPDSQHGWLSYSEACRLAGRTEAAREAARQAWQLAPQNLFAVAQYARCLMPYADHRLISELVRTGIRSDAGNDWALDILASCAVSVDDWEQALSLYERLLQSNATNPHYRYMQGLALSVSGMTEQALQSLEKIRRDPQFSGRVLNLIQDIDATRVNRDELEAVLGSQQTISSQDKIYALQALGRLHHSERRFEEAFSCWQRANELKASGARYKADDWDVFAARLMRLGGNVAADSSPSPPGGKSPIFIVGLPRSGTTLLERILVNSGHVAALGELRDFEVLMQMHMGESITPLPFDFRPEKAAAIDWVAIGESYCERLASRDSSGRHPCDKNPFNFLFCGLILAALPDARIIHIKKHPLDAGLGTFRHIFAAAAPWSYRLADIAHFYVLYDRVMAHWVALYPDRIYQIHYDELVSDPEVQSSMLFEWLNLPWSGSVPDTAASKGVVRSASANQVRSPIHQQAVQVWRNYASQLSALKDSLERGGVLDGND
ncbi:tetratricopeptide repeat-containing sulfotransferase family protein [Pseudohongiella spirulinae]|uniref:Sulfotransferase n=1 Tax=Pseudohongiella spirulinae TaxID=1249552 RepID=A0A0S2KAA0_9GAMM|nr:sulfotransferase [Pseudohongiella spirulinae]ALO45210.1 hypothetical protein PS2015_524 [Pseudohongiella spirulinae]